VFFITSQTRKKMKETEHYYTKTPTSRLKFKKVEFVWNSRRFKFITPSGVFSYGGIDKGSRILLENAIVKPGWKLLDLGCGYGFIGICLAASYPLDVLMADINSRAVSFTRKNIKLNNVGNAEVIQSDLFDKISGKYDTIISNPPTHAGREVCFKLIIDSIHFLKKRGLLQIVARHNKGGKVLMDKMKEVFGNVETSAIQSGYRVYYSVKN